jgi:polysaccharide export outer membrane protein
MKNFVPATAVFSSVLGRMAVVALTLVLLAPVNLQAQPSAAQVEQFKTLPRAQQEALAQQYGVDLDQIAGGESAAASTLGTPALPLDQDPRVRERQRKLEAEQDDDIDDAEPKKIERFGERLFNNKVSTFAVTDNAVVPSDYRLGAGDELQIQIYGKDNEKYSIQVGRSGEIQLPRLGPVMLAGLTFEEAQGVIRHRVNEQLIGDKVVIAMGRLRAISVFMAGELKVPGSYSISALSTASQALYVAGGVTDIGTLRDIQVKRGGKVIARFDAYDLLLRGDAGQDVRLQSGDVVFVPPFQRLATIEGEVKRPMSYELLRSESASDLVTMAGGYARNAYPSASVLTRKSMDKNLPTVLNIDLTETVVPTPLLDGDTLRVPEAANTYENAINIQGAAIRPGVYAWSQGMRVSDLLTSVKRDLLPSVDLDYALIVREKNQRLQISVKQFNVGDAITAPGTLADPLLNPRDKLVLFELVDLLALSDEERGILTEKEPGSDEEKDEEENEEEEKKLEAETERLKYSREVLLAPILIKLASQASPAEPVQIVSISGAVKAPGSYPLEPGDRAFDLVRAAGGLKDSAYLLEAEFRRITAGDAGRVGADYQSVALTSLSNGGSKDNLALQSRDHLTVRNIPNWNPVDSIEVLGEVKFPGMYLVRPGETLSDVVNRAGGLTQEAFADGAIYTRVEVAQVERLRAKEFATSLRNGFAASLLTLEQKTSEFEEILAIADVLEEYEGVGRLVINLNSALAGDQIADLEVVDGDKLMIPGKNSTVTVVGEVRRQGTHSYQRNFGLDDYLSLSAGATARADDKAIYIVKANGSVTTPKKASWVSFRGSSQTLEPGDSIIVPIDSAYKDSTTVWRDVTQIFYQGAIAVIALTAL